MPSGELTSCGCRSDSRLGWPDRPTTTGEREVPLCFAGCGAPPDRIAGARLYRSVAAGLVRDVGDPPTRASHRPFDPGIGSGHRRRCAFDAHPCLVGPTGETQTVGDQWVPHRGGAAGRRLDEGGGCSMTSAGCRASDSPGTTRFGDRGVLRANLGVAPGGVVAVVPGSVAVRLDPVGHVCPAAAATEPATAPPRCGPRHGQPGLGGQGARRLASRSGVASPAAVDGPERVQRLVRHRPATQHRSSEHSRDVPPPQRQRRRVLRSDVRDDGALLLTSPLAPFGHDGAYLIVVRPDGNTASVRRYRWASALLCGSMTRERCAPTMR